MHIYFLNVTINLSINDYSFKYICLACYLTLRFYCFNCSAMSNLNSADSTTLRFIKNFGSENTNTA